MNLKEILPEAIKSPAKKIRDTIYILAYRGTERFCPICEKTSVKFASSGSIPRKEARCVHCGALARHRFAWEFFKRKTNLFDGRKKSMLHVAPEPFIEKRLKNYLGGGYLSADLYNKKALVKMDLTDIKFPEENFDIIYCSHVLEHIPDDRKALSELKRVLKSGGWAVIMVPININAEHTFEDPTVTSTEERLRMFGHKDHVRIYGKDFINRVQEAGFEVNSFTPFDILKKEDAIRFGIANGGGEVFYCRKPQ